MWSRGLVLLLLLAGVAHGSHNPGWTHNVEYVFEIRGGILVSLDQLNSNYTGIVTKAELHVRPRSDGNLGARIVQPQYAQIHSELFDGWETQIPDAQLNYQQLPLSPQPFQIMMNKGVVQGLLVAPSMSNWEANVLKGIVSQFQLDTEAVNLIPSSINTLREPGQKNAVYKTMEPTIAGISETLYEIHPIRSYAVKENLNLIDINSEYTEILKTKNLTHSVELPAYHFGLHGFDDSSVDNQIGNFYSRSINSRALISGPLERFTLQNIVTEDIIYLRPDFAAAQLGSVKTKLNFTLLSMVQQIQQFEDVAQPINLGLVYRYNQPHSKKNQPRPALNYNQEQNLASSESYTTNEDFRNNLRFKRSSKKLKKSHSHKSHEDKSDLDEPPQIPLSPFFVGFNGQAMQNIKENVLKLTQQIDLEMRQPEQNTVGKFVVLTKLVKLLSEDEMKEIGEQMDPYSYSWMAFRDAVAHAGTGPSLLAAKEWIKKDKIRGRDAAKVISVIADSAEQPNEDFIKKFYDIVQDKKILKEKYLNESAVLAFTRLVHNSKEEFVSNKIIPYLSQQLDKAVAMSDTQKIHTYIRALGNVGHKEILQVFEPYLEGRKQMSQFQRVLIVLVLNKLVDSDPKVARGVLLRIYSNGNEFEQARVAAVYQLMNTNPSASLLQSMAMRTNTDLNNYVNSAVKSAIERASQVEDPRYSVLRHAAQSAKPFLTSKEFGAQYSKLILQDYVRDNVDSIYKEIVATFGGEDSWLPKGVSYMLQGCKNHSLLTVQALVSSLEDLVSVLHWQSPNYQRLLQQKHQEQGASKKLSSEHIAKMLNLQNEQREQLEGNIFLQIGGLQEIWSFDNRTIENLTEVFNEWKQKLHQGQQMKFTTMTIKHRSVLSLPTIWGLPFVYNYEIPVIGEAKIDLQKKVDGAQFDFKVSGFLSGRIQAEFGFFTPFDHQRYSAGYDKNLHISLPVISQRIQVDPQSKQMRWEFENVDNQENVNLVSFNTRPYTAQYDMYNFNPKKEVGRAQQHSQRIDTVFGQESTGVALSIRMSSDKPLNVGQIYDNMKQQGVLSSILDQDVQNLEFNVQLKSARSTTKKMVVQLGYSKTQDTRDSQEQDSLVVESLNRQQEALRNVTSNSRAKAYVIDTIVVFQGQKEIKYVNTLASGKDEKMSKSQLIWHFQRFKQNKIKHVHFEAFTQGSKTNGLNLNHEMSIDPTIQTDVKITIEDGDNVSNIISKIAFAKSGDRKQYLMEQEDYHECQRDMEEEDTYQSHSCLRVLTQANLMDQVAVTIEYDNIAPEIVNATYNLWSLVRQRLIPRVSEDVLAKDTNSKRVRMQGQFSPDLKLLNVSIESPYGKVQIKNTPVKEWFRKIAIPHPSYSLVSRLGSHVFKYDTDGPICVVDSSTVRTLDNRTYPVHLGHDGTVLLQYVPRVPPSMANQPQQSVLEQMNYQIESYIVYARSSPVDASQKEVKIVVQAPKTQGKIMDVTLQPSKSSQYPEVLVNEQPIQIDGQGNDKYESFLRVDPLPHGAIWVEIANSFRILYNGVSVRITLQGDKFRDASRGLCGTFTGEDATDFTTPENCILANPQSFVNSWTVNINGQRTKRMSPENQECSQKKIEYTNIITPQIIQHGLFSCTAHQTQYVVENNETCFTIRPVPVCKPGCQQRGSITKPMPVHCVNTTSLSDLWKTKINQGASPDLSLKAPTRTAMITIPIGCIAA